MDPEEVEVKNAEVKNVEVKNVEVKNADKRKWVIGAALARATIFQNLNFCSVGHPNCYKSSNCTKKPENALTDKVFIVVFIVVILFSAREGTHW